MITRGHDMPFGAKVSENGATFALWAPDARTLDVIVDNGPPRPMSPVGEGWHEATVREAHDGSLYRFRVNGELLIPDPASRFQPNGPFADSCVVDPHRFVWSDDKWTGRPWSEAVIYETHIGAFTPEGTYAALTERLQSLHKLGITALELMPLADCPGTRNWGYDGVLPFAPNESYGRPSDLKRMIECAHAFELMVLLDVVYNHLGPSGNFLHNYASSFFTDRHTTPWGAGLNFDGAASHVVREFFIHNALYWLEEFHFDGLRLDAVHAIADDSELHVLAELAERVRATIPDREIHLILENDNNEAHRLERDERGKPRVYTAQWNDDLHHCWHILLTGETEGYYEDYADDPSNYLARSIAEGFAYQGEASAYRGGRRRGEASRHLTPIAFVAFLQNHDQIGNRAFGERLCKIADPNRVSLARAILLLSPQVPMLFMGEEWQVSSPFLYFVDFADDPKLSNAVREGRRSEFGRFRAFASADAIARIPDPTLADTFEGSKLDWNECRSPTHKRAYEECKELLSLRAKEIVPLLGKRFYGATQGERNDVIDVVWNFEGEQLRLILNLSKQTAHASADHETRTIWQSEGVEEVAETIILPPWSARLVRSSEM
jgi:maltooligosyltrehalose trehalohydrolase